MLGLLGLVEGSHRPCSVPRRAQLVVLAVVAALGAAVACTTAAVFIGLVPADRSVVLNLPSGPTSVRPWSVVAATLLLSAVSVRMTVVCAHARSTFVADTVALARTWPAGTTEIEDRVELLLAYRETDLVRTVGSLVPSTLARGEREDAGLTFMTAGRPGSRPNPSVIAAFTAATLTLAATILTAAVAFAATS